MLGLADLSWRISCWSTAISDDVGCAVVEGTAPAAGTAPLLASCGRTEGAIGAVALGVLVSSTALVTTASVCDKSCVGTGSVAVWVSVSGVAQFGLRLRDTGATGSTSGDAGSALFDWAVATSSTVRRIGVVKSLLLVIGVRFAVDGFAIVFEGKETFADAAAPDGPGCLARGVAAILPLTGMAADILAAMNVTDLLQPWPAAEMNAYPISPAIKHPAAQGLDLLQPIGERVMPEDELRLRDGIELQGAKPR